MVDLNAENVIDGFGYDKQNEKYDNLCISSLLFYFSL